MFSKLFKKIEGLMQNLTLITIYLILADTTYLYPLKGFLLT